MRSARRAVVSMLVVTIVLSATSTPTSAGGRHDEPRGTPREGVWGIDVSHHQGRIDWGRVARAGYHFAIAKATEGRTWVDRTYPRNRAQAEANGLAFGAYHFARPGGGTHDAVREANHFVEVARLRPGDIIPVLDLESSGGLSRRRLTRWILAWLRQVRRRLGVRPMVYTSPRGWAERTGDTSAIARAGFDALWVAHWEVREPSLPAKAWGGHGWSLWQRDTCGRVPGVRGCVDIDRVAGPSLEPLRIDTADPGPPAVRIAPPETLTDAVVIRFDEVVAWISRGNVVLRTSRGSRPPVELTCRSGIGWPVDCGSGDVRKVLVRPRRPLVAGRTYRVVVNGAAAEDLVRDRSGTSAPEVARTFTAPTRLEQGSAAIA
ncbi:MAG TPA: glycoside hydrolase family 25 protein, partial [Actinomycetota bacterium]|nr:glycoside hydrolase family 25 protein [Actinomycetota bacterium]